METEAVKEKIEIVSIFELVENDEQSIKGAIINVKDGFISKTEGPILVIRKNGKFILGDGYHRVAQAIINGEKKISATIKAVKDA